jgi:hypothetical protein
MVKNLPKVIANSQSNLLGEKRKKKLQTKTIKNFFAGHWWLMPVILIT